MLFVGEVDMVVVPGAEGDYGHHGATMRRSCRRCAPASSSRRRGLPQERDFRARRSPPSVTPKGLTVLAEYMAPLAEARRGGARPRNLPCAGRCQRRQDRRQASGRAGKARPPEAAPPGDLRVAVLLPILVLPGLDPGIQKPPQGGVSLRKCPWLNSQALLEEYFRSETARSAPPGLPDQVRQ